jgi:SAM-dependent methyltransferase
MTTAEQLMLNGVKSVVRKMPILGPMAVRLHLPFKTSSDYWEKRYAKGGNSGVGSYGRLAHFKAEFLNDFVEQHRINSVIEYGCGDGSQLKLARYPSYAGIDVSPKAVEICRALFATDRSKRFFHTDAVKTPMVADLALSLDVVYHLVEDSAFESYMHKLFDSAQRFVIIYSSNLHDAEPTRHVRHRRFTSWVEQYKPRWYVTAHVANVYPFDAARPGDTSLADFYVFAPTLSSLAD